jgi:hypothetical protein
VHEQFTHITQALGALIKSFDLYFFVTRENEDRYVVIGIPKDQSEDCVIVRMIYQLQRVKLKGEERDRSRKRGNPISINFDDTSEVVVVGG